MLLNSLLTTLHRAGPLALKRSAISEAVAKVKGTLEHSSKLMLKRSPYSRFRAATPLPPTTTILEMLPLASSALMPSRTCFATAVFTPPQRPLSEVTAT